MFWPLGVHAPHPFPPTFPYLKACACGHGSPRRRPVRLVTGLALNGAGIVHDSEIAMVGRTSEDVDQVLGCGQR